MPDTPLSRRQQQSEEDAVGVWLQIATSIRDKGSQRLGKVALLVSVCLTTILIQPSWSQQSPTLPERIVEESIAPPALRQTLGIGEVAQPRIVHADIVALDQMLVYNRFGSFNPYGMIFALRRDVWPLNATSVRKPDADECAKQPGTVPAFGHLEPGEVRLRDCKRPRPLVLRANAGDILELTVTNLLRPPPAPDISQTWCDTQPNTGTPPTRADIRYVFDQQCRERTAQQQQQQLADTSADWPATRNLSIVMPGLEPLPTKQKDGTVAIERACLGLNAVAPGNTFTCRWRLEREGTHLFSSLAAPAGGEGDGGSLIHGLFGALLVEPKESLALRSQITKAAFDRVWAQRATPATGPVGAPQGVIEDAPGFVRHARSDTVHYDASVTYRFPSLSDRPSEVFTCATGPDPLLETVPILHISRDCEGEERIGRVTYRRAEIVHGDLNAIIIPRAQEAHRPGAAIPVTVSNDEDARMRAFLEQDATKPFREFTVIFHDELKTFYADAFQALGQFGQLSGVRDGFAINYGSSGLGSILLANREGIGPAANCPECQYEEFFLESWANGDPALLEAYPDDPSNVHHSYLNDKVVFRNLHAGKETHVFHLHTHQWFAGNDQNRGSYLDSQTIGPQQGFTYRIYQGGLDRHAPDGATPGGWWETAQGSGNRNRTPGDAIFHCHLYPHFAQGMWELWRVHDVLEDGTRVLPDGQAKPGPSVRRNDDAQVRRDGSVHAETGAWLGGGQARGTPVPGVIPLPDGAAPPLPTYGATSGGMPGYPFYIAGLAGHRTPQPPLDIAFDPDSQALLDGGLPRHLVTGGQSLPSVLTKEERGQVLGGAPLPGGLVARMLALGDATTEYGTLNLRVLPHEGTPLERNAMAFHHDGQRPGGGGALNLRDATGRPIVAQERGSYLVPRLPRTFLGPNALSPTTGWFSVNGAPPAPGAPFADPCGAATGLAGTPYRRFLPLGPQAGHFVERNLAHIEDQFTSGGPSSARFGPLVPDPGLTGFRRFDVSAVQIDMVVNRAGWHDPLARIAVLTPDAIALKGPNGEVTKTARAEPFFFRAFSGECIELRHTNELPKDLELDDFQLRVPTDTIGQHIHLVKFDVTSSDGSGNGFNYEDGTFAADEILARICAATGGRDAVDRSLLPGEDGTRRVAARMAECGALRQAREEWAAAVESADAGRIAAARRQLEEVQLWRKRRVGADRGYFQTTVQRWFADPILSNTGDTRATDRTLRTVFSHDHFAPSNIQQHGYYTALMIEPQGSSFCVNGPIEDSATAWRCAEGQSAARVSQEAPWDGTGTPVFTVADGRHVGTRATVFDPICSTSHPSGLGGGPLAECDALHPDTREFALAIADFALLYDGADQPRQDFDADTKPGDGDALDGEAFKGLARLVSEAECRIVTEDAHDPDLGSDELVPAQSAPLCAGLPSQILMAHRGQVMALREHAVAWREAHGRPVAPPPRPEAISQKHHDPYLVNYRNEPIPLRLAANRVTSNPPVSQAPDFVRNPCVVPDEARRPYRINHRDLQWQRSDSAGDAATAFRSAWGAGWAEGHGDPCTPVLDARLGDRVQFRLIQGAQEVQHMFTVEGRPFRRNLDQAYPTAVTGTAASPGRDLRSRCLAASRDLDWRPRDYERFLQQGPGTDLGWAAIRAALAQCDNLEGYSGAQEIGISEHFEFSSVFRLEAQFLRKKILGPGALLDLPQLLAPGQRVLPRIALPPGVREMPLEDRAQMFRPGPDQGMLVPPGYNDEQLRGPVDPAGGELPFVDYLFHFGSLDALWNGAWGLLRVHAESTVGGTDVTRCLADRNTATGERVLPSECHSRWKSAILADLSARVPQIEPAEATDSRESPSGCPARQSVRAILVARRIGPLAYDQSLPLADPDALAFITLAEADLPDGVFARLFAGQQAPGETRPLAREVPQDLLPALEAATVVAALRPRPIRMQAGECLEMAVVNGLQNVQPDYRGDAPMPRIVPLNLDRRRSGLGPTGQPDDPNYRWPGLSVRDQLRPSAKLAVSVAMPGLDHIQATPSPYGINPGDALEPGQMVVLRFYAGRVGIQVGNRQYTPYAFGPVVVRSVSDPFNHWQHGLFAVIVVEPEGSNVVTAEPQAGWTGAVLSMPGVPDPSKPGTPPPVRVREHLLMLQDGLNLYAPALTQPALERQSDATPGPTPAPLSPSMSAHMQPLPNCRVCDDSYDHGEKGVSYRSAPFALRLPGQQGRYDPSTYPRDEADLNRRQFPPNFFTDGYRAIPTPLLEALRNEQVMIRVVHPGGRARQRSFSMLGAAYDDLLPGFGSGHSGLLGPGKGLTAGFCAPRIKEDYLWRDGPQHIFAGGAWGQLRVQQDQAPTGAACPELPEPP